MTKQQTPTTDREQLDSALAALTSKGYYARARYWCCNSCALADIPDEYSERYVFWHAQADADAFGEADNGYSYLSRKSATALAQAAGYPVEEFEEDEDEWTRHNAILFPLFLNWDGDAKEIISTLGEFGFSVEFEGRDIDHVDPSKKLRVLPGRTGY